ncbi:MAG TPA: non-canonical purine NTP pyrophosphatase [Candidatus Saccharimonadales bacterium]|nr:non-canonical purine NTP pyrophosphatase [Candidatus Saccharimonadales bacterium]
MQPIYFVTGNDHKFAEAHNLLPQLERVNFDLPEEQSLDPQVVIAKKLEVARTQQDGPLVVEDTSLYLEGLNGFPGPLIKWMLYAVGNQGIYDLTQKIHSRAASAKTVIGYDDGLGNVQFFEGSIDGQIVAPNGIDGFGWDEIFQPNGLNETFAEMGDDYKPEFSMRTEAFTKLRDYLASSSTSN